MTLGERIQFIRKQNGISQDELATKLHLSRHAVAKWEQGASEPNLDCLTEMSNIFNVDLQFLITGEHSSNKKIDETEQAECKKATFFSVVKKILYIANWCLPFILSVFSVLFVFFIGHSASAFYNNNSATEQGYTIFYFFGEMFNQFYSLPENFTSQAGRFFPLVANGIMCATLLALFMVAVCTFSIISIIKNARALIKKEKPEHNYSILSGTLYLLCALVYMSFSITRLSIKYNTTSTLSFTHLNGVTIAGVVVVCVFVSCSIAFNIYNNIKERGLNLKTFIFKATNFLFATVLIILIGCCGVDVHGTGSSSLNTSISTPLWKITSSLFSSNDGNYLGVVSEICTYLLFATLVAFFVVVAISLIKKGKAVISFAPFKSKIVCLDVWSVILSALFLLLYIIVGNEYATTLKDAFAITLTFPITIFVFAVISLIISIICNSIHKTNEDNSEQQNEQTAIEDNDKTVNDEQTTTYTNEETKKRITFIESIASPCLTFLCALFPLIFTFLIGADVGSQNNFDTAYRLNSAPNVFHYLSTYIFDMQELATAFSQTVFLSSFSIYVWIEFALAIICAVGAIIVVPILSLTSITKNVLVVAAKKQYKSLKKEAYASVFIYFACVLLFGFLNNTTVIQDANCRSITFNGATITGVVLCMLALTLNRAGEHVFCEQPFNAKKFTLSLFKCGMTIVCSFALTGVVYNFNAENGRTVFFSPVQYYHYTYQQYLNNLSNGSLVPNEFPASLSVYLLIIATVTLVLAIGGYLLRLGLQMHTIKNKFVNFVCSYLPQILVVAYCVLSMFSIRLFLVDTFIRFINFPPICNYPFMFFQLFIMLVAIFDLVFTLKTNRKLKKLNN